VLEVRLEHDLCGADSGRIDVQWTTRGDYKFRYTDSDFVQLCRLSVVFSAFDAGLDTAGNLVTGKNRMLTIQVCFSLHRVFSNGSDASLSMLVLPRKLDAMLHLSSRVMAGRR
jgi:hypothetical protein